MEEPEQPFRHGYLFLLEFLVDNLQSLESNDILKKIGHDTCAWFRAQTRVTFQFGPYQPVEIWDDEFPNKKPCSSGESRWKSTKSCLFGLQGEDVESGISSFVLFISVYRRLSAGFHPGDILIGTGDYELKDLFNEVLAILQNDPCELPASKTIKLGNCIRKTADNIDKGENPCVGGVLDFYVRLSCYGKNINTQFQLEEEEKSFLVKGKCDSQTFLCDRLPVPYCPRPITAVWTPAFPPLKPPKVACLPKPAPRVCPPRKCWPPPCPATLPPCIRPPPTCPPPSCPPRPPRK